MSGSGAPCSRRSSLSSFIRFLIRDSVKPSNTPMMPACARKESPLTRSSFLHAIIDIAIGNKLFDRESFNPCYAIHLRPAFGIPVFSNRECVLKRIPSNRATSPIYRIRRHSKKCDLACRIKDRDCQPIRRIIINLIPQSSLFSDVMYFDSCFYEYDLLHSTVPLAVSSSTINDHFAHAYYIRNLSRS